MDTRDPDLRSPKVDHISRQGKYGTRVIVHDIHLGNQKRKKKARNESIMNNIIKARLSAKKATKHRQTANTFALSSAKQYTDFLEKYNRTDQEVKTWMDKTKVLITEIHNMVDITPGALSEHLAAASGYGLNHTSAVFLMIHAAMTEQKYLIPMVDIPVRLSEEEKAHLLSSNCNPNPDMVERLHLYTNKTYSLRVDRENWYDKPSKLEVNTGDMIEFI